MLDVAVIVAVSHFTSRERELGTAIVQTISQAHARLSPALLVANNVWHEKLAGPASPTLALPPGALGLRNEVPARRSPPALNAAQPQHGDRRADGSPT